MTGLQEPNTGLMGCQEKIRLQASELQEPALANSMLEMAWLQPTCTVSLQDNSAQDFAGEREVPAFCFLAISTLDFLSSSNAGQADA